MFFVLTADGCRDNSIRGMKSKMVPQKWGEKDLEEEGSKRKKMEKKPSKDRPMGRKNNVHPNNFL